MSELEGAGLSASRTRQAHGVIAQALDAAVNDGYVSRNVARGAKLPKMQRREAPYFDPAAVQRIADAMAEPYGLLVEVLGVLGLRWGEAVALRRRSVDMLRRRLHVEESLGEVNGRIHVGPTKTHAARTVPLTPSLAAALERHLDDRVGSSSDAFVFCGPEGGPLRYSNFRTRYWQPALVRACLRSVGIHALRHSAAAALISAGASPKALQAMLGHASAGFSLTRYGHLFDADLDALAARLDDARREFSRPARGLAAASER